MEKYIALLRGINISGKNKIPMSELKKEFEVLGYENVTTYLNSGNVIFTSNIAKEEIVINNIHKMIEEKFCIDIPVYVMKASQLKELLENQPEWWGTSNKEIYDNIIFIIPPTTFEKVYNTIGEPKQEYRKTNWWAKTASTSISNSITIRTANTMRKVLELCNNL